MLPVKELHYFDRSTRYPSPNTLSETRVFPRLRKFSHAKAAVQRITGAWRAGDRPLARWWARYMLWTYTDAWYQSLFRSARGLTGDITPSYAILDEEDVARMRAVAPDAKIIFLMRNPIDRAWSMYRFAETFGVKVDGNNLEAFQRYTESPGQALRSNYARTIALYTRHYGPGRVMLGFHDAIREQPEALLSAVLTHIGAKEVTFARDLHQVNNRSRPMEMPAAYREYLEEKYRSDIEALAARYGGYAARWLTSLHGEEVGRMHEMGPPPPVVQP